ncbi:MAG: hypothetical protein HXX20_04730 [Chloroflexi bacterium]|nr:hypothetical protein [Chloroflexota bacterium]
MLDNTDNTNSSAIPYNLFVLNPRCRPFLTGDRRDRQGWIWALVIALFFGFMGFIMVTIPFRSSRYRLSLFPSIVVIFLGLFLIIVGLAFLYVVARRHYLEKTGQILQGELVSIKGERSNISTGSHSNRKRKHIVSASYRFRSPSGRTLEGNNSAARDDLKHHTLPTAGTPVAVLYINDKYFGLL